jgi:UDP-N-acetylglucosamine--N-acetylmuramyl-(pentapeptide) pyrophosphoryl-undecaprenol N-acetylglucosamine transferase
MMIAVTGGGTGGHIFPAVSVIEELRKRGREDIVWIGSKRGKERECAQQIGVQFRGISTGKLRRYFSLRNFTDIFGVLFGILQALLLFCRTKPKVLFSKGGFVSVPPVLAARILRVPVITHESDTIPGLATKIISRSASVVCVGFRCTADYFPDKTVCFTGNPVRERVLKGSRERGVQWLGFENDLPIVFVVGGSLGSSAINEAVWKMLDEKTLAFNIAHGCGRTNLREGLSGKKNYRQFEFLEELMGDVLQAASVVVSRAGAGALYEIGVLGKASILIPLPRTASRGEQIENARYWEDQGACVVIPSEKLTEKTLKKTIEGLLGDTRRITRMGRAAQKLVRPGASMAIADIIEDTIADKAHMSF